MARPLRVEFPGAIYHVSVRMLGDWKKEDLLFQHDAGRNRFLAQLGERVEQYGIRLSVHQRDPRNPRLKLPDVAPPIAVQVMAGRSATLTLTPALNSPSADRI